ncbi:hypothetical protein RSAG8_08655, partial [Rhizoctonia solani AG-8 WAC10335]
MSSTSVRSKSILPGQVDEPIEILRGRKIAGGIGIDRDLGGCSFMPSKSGVLREHSRALHKSLI